MTALQRVRVGVTGLAVIVLLIILASAVFRTAHDDAPVVAVGMPDGAAIANLTAPGNSVDPSASGPVEPLADLGVAPAPDNSIAAAPTPAPAAR